jgi:hypothetical protein
MRRRSKIAAGLLTIVVVMPLLIISGVYANAWYYRSRAEQLLAVLKTVRPGVTTETEYLRLIRPFEAAPGDFRVGDELVPGALAIGNRSRWIERVLTARNGLLDDLLAWRVIPPGIYFDVNPAYDGGIVSQLHLHISMAVTGHPPGASVFWSASKYERGDAGYQDYLPGYRVSQEGLSGRPPWIFFVWMDERATPDERNSALDFQFRCFTRFSGCEEAAMFLQPAPNR